MVALRASAISKSEDSLNGGGAGGSGECSRNDLTQGRLKMRPKPISVR